MVTEATPVTNAGQVKASTSGITANEPVPFIPTLQALRKHREKLLQIFDRHGAHSVKIFGSVARGEATDQSDIDFLIDYDRDRTTPWFPGGLINDLETYLHWKVDITTVHGLSSLIAENVAKDTIEL